MKRLRILLLLLLAACANPAPTFSKVGTLAPGSTLTLRNARGDIDAYAPVHGKPQNQYTVEAFATQRNATRTAVSAIGKNLAVCSFAIDAQPPDSTNGTCTPGDPGVIRYLVRGPKDVTLRLSTQNGSINVADVSGVVDAHVGKGDIKVLVPGYAQAYAKDGNVTVFFGSTDWPGTLHFGAGKGNVEVWINATAKAHVHFHTDDGTIFTDFPLKGTSHGNNETIDGTINGGGNRSVDVEIHEGIVRVLQLKPQM
ncbi:MAG: DUF4097 domain-containing protein [Candidatus Eremiobacteraeota bacterium]|nr:DUF4097 domain-containing protein [Candidatus Eremiobacteraeota bacterium]